MVVTQLPGSRDMAVLNPYMMVTRIKFETNQSVLLKNRRMVIRLPGIFQPLIRNSVLKPQSGVHQIGVASKMIKFSILKGNQLYIQIGKQWIGGFRF